MACDDAGKAILFGGFRNSMYQKTTWEWDGSAGAWTDRTPSTMRPPARFMHALAYDSDSYVTVLFGGRGSLVEYNDTWERDERTGRWSEKTPAAGNPPARGGHALAYDAKRKVTVLFGGRESNTSNPARQDTWEWNGSVWEKRTDPADCSGYPRCIVCTPTTCPSYRYMHAMVYDASRERVVVFGGYYYDGGNAYDLNDVWEWDGDTGVWVERTPISGDMPAARSTHAMAYDSDRGVVMVYGGLQDYAMWEWDGDGDSGNGRWQRHDLVGTGPGYKSRHVMFYDTARKKAVLYGGADGQRDIWEWDATTNQWKKRTPSGLNPVGREFSAMVYDTLRERAVVFGGRERVVPMDDTWEWDSAVGSRPAEIFEVRFASAQAENEEVVSLAVSFVAGGSGHSASGEDGAGLYIWDSHPGAWRLVTSNGAAAGAPDSLSWATDEPPEVARLLFGKQQSVILAVAPLHSSGTATQLSTVSVDYVEVTVRYRLP